MFDRRVTSHPDCIPDDKHMVLGDFRATIPDALARIGRPAALLHGDVGSGDATKSAALATWLAPSICPLLIPGALVVCDQSLLADGLEALKLPEGVEEGRYFMYLRR